jgi:hypothetical protein
LNLVLTTATEAGEIVEAAMLRGLIVWNLVGAVALALAATASHAADSCYSNPAYPELTMTYGDSGLVYHRGDETTVMTLNGGGGTGIAARSAIEADGTEHEYMFIGDTLIVDMVPYEPGCPGGLVWTDMLCTQTLISQVDPYVRNARFYYEERGSPLTTCSLPAPFRAGEVVDLKCSSGKSLKVDATNYPLLVVGGTEMTVYDGDLPCH